MPSPPDDQIQTQPKPDSTQSSDRQSNAPPSQPPPPTQPPPPSNHSPVMGFPGYNQPPYPNYPNPAYPQQYAYAQAPPASYYGSSYPTPPNHAYHRPASSGFFRGILTGLMILVVLLCISTTITWLVLRPRIPHFSVTHFTVSGFNLTGPVFTAQWTANLTLENPNTKLNGYFDRIEGFIYHRNSNGEDDSLSTAFFKPMLVETKKSVEIGEVLTAGDKEKPAVPSWVAEDMKKERESGTVSFSLRMIVWVTFKTEGWSARERGLKVFCEKLKVAFEGTSGNGAVLLTKPLPCLVYV